MDAVEHLEVAEIKRTLFRALTRLRAATIKEFDTIARLETQVIDAYNDAHHYRAENMSLPISTRTRRQWRQTNSSLSTEQIYAYEKRMWEIGLLHFKKELASTIEVKAADKHLLENLDVECEQKKLSFEEKQKDRHRIR